MVFRLRKSPRRGPWTRRPAKPYFFRSPGILLKTTHAKLIRVKGNAAQGCEINRGPASASGPARREPLERCGDRRGFAGAFGVPVKRQRLLVWRQGLLATDLVIEYREVGLGGIVPVRPPLPDPRTQGRLAGPKIQDPQRRTERSRQRRELLTPGACRKVASTMTGMPKPLTMPARSLSRS
jgi:hypothetical protein